MLAITDELDSAGNTVKAVTKGFAIAAAVLTVIALLGAFMSEVNTAAAELGVTGITNFDVMNPMVFFGLLVGAAIPAVFSAMLMLGVDRNAQRMVAEIHRQFKEIVGLKEGKEGVEPEYDKCIVIATDGAIKELIPAGLMAIIATFVVGFIGGVQAFGGFSAAHIVRLAGSRSLMSNSGVSWDNGKKYVESGHEGRQGQRRARKRQSLATPSVIRSKTPQVPSINTQITVVSLVASLMSTLFLTLHLF
jgi:K(+)-stimulated pyrophosphate-energized sodium pump